MAKPTDQITILGVWGVSQRYYSWDETTQWEFEKIPGAAGIIFNVTVEADGIFVNNYDDDNIFFVEDYALDGQMHEVDNVEVEHPYVVFVPGPGFGGDF